MQHRHWFLSCIGNTPLIRLKFPEGHHGAQVWCKLEFMNPAGSSKDRMCLAIVESLESRDLLRHGDVLLEASGGNTAISLAMIAAAKAMPTSHAGHRPLKAALMRGAKIVFLPPTE
jgi:cysteine synthase A